ncbi:FHA domain-containing protein [Infirmifilum lucidum]|uniref:FHA domain-containing protein n=1 Tax=Infirmifilum lucidum TaxID=2776706 RepID=A0A7L9FFT0_9CREN|nr:FHA domain-containing protein [Infirmifilum lucidum]QOJ78650.1 FHA domain-containing protein [Infirmifilum lucidum]
MVRFIGFGEESRRAEGLWPLLAALTACLLAFTALSQPAAVVGFHKDRVTASQVFTLNLVIFSATDQILSGEFNFSYTSRCINLTRVEAGGNWTVSRVPGNKYLFYAQPLKMPSTTIASIEFRILSGSCKQPMSVNLTLFKAAGKGGQDFNVTVKNAVVQVFIQQQAEQVFPEIETTEPSRVNWLPYALILIIPVLALIGAVALRARLIERKAYYFLVGENFTLEVSARDRVFSREDFAPYLGMKAMYLSRRSRGGQFRIAVLRDGVYIRDDFSTNPTLVNGVPIKGKGWVKLSDGAEIRVADSIRLIFRQGIKTPEKGKTNV